MQAQISRLTALILLSAGFLGGMIAVMGCGGSGNVAMASGGSTTVVHSKTFATPVTWTNAITFAVEFTPPNPDTIVLAVEVLGEVQTGAADVLVRAQARRGVQAQQLGVQITATQSATAPLSIIAPYALSAGAPPGGTFEVEVSMEAVLPGISSTVTSLTLRIITSEGIVHMDPSPDLL